MAAPVPSPAGLTGRWRYRRRLRDARTGQCGSARGMLTIDGANRSWAETGELRWDGRSVAISRTMGFALIDGAWWTTFADGRAFHPWRAGEVVHPCGEDLYRGFIRFGAGVLRIGWDVTGPVKRQRILTTYRRLDSDGHGDTVVRGNAAV